MLTLSECLLNRYYLENVAPWNLHES